MPLEKTLLLYVAELDRSDPQGCYGYQLAQAMGMPSSAYKGTIYRALLRLERMGLLAAHLDHNPPPEGQWIPRRFYSLVISK